MMMTSAADSQQQQPEDILFVKSKRRSSSNSSAKTHKRHPSARKLKLLNELCAICLDPIDSQRMLKISCGHFFHVDCISQQLDSKWPGTRISLKYLHCGLCKEEISHARLEDRLVFGRSLKKKLEEIALRRASEEQIDTGEKKGYRKTEYLLDILAFYMCVDCHEPYCGGLINCAQDLEEIDESNLRCQECTFKKLDLEQKEKEPKDYRCFTHGYKSAVYKCDSCCSIATYDCIYNHYCDRCHNQAYLDKNYPCPGPEKCPLGIIHPPNLPAKHSGLQNAPVPFVLGCSKCIGAGAELEFGFESAPYKF